MLLSLPYDLLVLICTNLTARELLLLRRLGNKDVGRASRDPIAWSYSHWSLRTSTAPIGVPHIAAALRVMPHLRSVDLHSSYFFNAEDRWPVTEQDRAQMQGSARLPYLERLTAQPIPSHDADLTELKEWYDEHPESLELLIDRESLARIRWYECSDLAIQYQDQQWRENSMEVNHEMQQMNSAAMSRVEVLRYMRRTPRLLDRIAETQLGSQLRIGLITWNEQTLGGSVHHQVDAMKMRLFVRLEELNLDMCHHLHPDHLLAFHFLPCIRLLTLHDHIGDTHISAFTSFTPFCDRLEYLRFTFATFGFGSLHRLMCACTHLLGFHLNLYAKSIKLVPMPLAPIETLHPQYENLHDDASSASDSVLGAFDRSGKDQIDIASNESFAEPASKRQKREHHTHSEFTPAYRTDATTPTNTASSTAAAFRHSVSFRSSVSPISFSDFLIGLPESYYHRLLSLCLNSQQKVSSDEQLQFLYQLWQRYPNLQCARVGRIVLSELAADTATIVTDPAASSSSSSQMLIAAAAAYASSFSSPSHSTQQHVMPFHAFAESSRLNSIQHDACVYQLRSSDGCLVLPPAFLDTQPMLSFLTKLKRGHRKGELELMPYELEYPFTRCDQSQFDTQLSDQQILSIGYWYS